MPSHNLKQCYEKGKSTEETLKHNHACIYNQCQLPYSKTMLRRTVKRSHAECMEAGKKRFKVYKKQTTFKETKPLRFFCREDNSLEQLLEPSTEDDYSINDPIRKYAVLLRDKHLLAKLSSCDLVV